MYTDAETELWPWSADSGFLGKETAGFRERLDEAPGYRFICIVLEEIGDLGNIIPRLLGKDEVTQRRTLRPIRPFNQAIASSPSTTCPRST